MLILLSRLEPQSPVHSLFQGRQERICFLTPNVTRYKHGARSMTAVIEMSRLAGKKRFDLLALPVKKQLDMPVDADEFFF